jgi:glutathione S-transferase
MMHCKGILVLCIYPKKTDRFVYYPDFPETSMLKFYYHPLSPIARRVWLALLEKQIPHQPVLVDLKARQNFQPDYLAIHPFHHVPAVVDGDLRLIESLAILDYLEAQFPQTSLSPGSPQAIARMKMVQLVIANELMPKLPQLVFLTDDTTPADTATLRRVQTVFTFLAEQLGEAHYFGGDNLSLADITVGATLPLLRRLGVDLQNYRSLDAWCDRVAARPAWQHSEPTPADLDVWQRWITLMVKRRQRQPA